MLVNSTQSRIKIVDTLVNLLRTIIEGDPDSLLPTVCIYTSYNLPHKRVSPGLFCLGSLLNYGGAYFKYEVSS